MLLSVVYVARRRLHSRSLVYADASSVASRRAAEFAKILTTFAFAMQNNALKFRSDCRLVHGCNSADDLFCFSFFDGMLRRWKKIKTLKDIQISLSFSQMSLSHFRVYVVQRIIFIHAFSYFLYGSVIFI